MARDLDIEIDPAELGNTPIFPPRRRCTDLIPKFISNCLRKNYNVLKATPREEWVLRSLFLRIFYNTQRVNQLIEQTPKPFHTGELVTPDKPKAAKDDDPFRWS